MGKRRPSPVDELLSESSESSSTSNATARWYEAFETRVAVAQSTRRSEWSSSSETEPRPRGFDLARQRESHRCRRSECRSVRRHCFAQNSRDPRDVKAGLLAASMSASVRIFDVFTKSVLRSLLWRTKSHHLLTCNVFRVFVHLFVQAWEHNFMYFLELCQLCHCNHCSRVIHKDEGQPRLSEAFHFKTEHVPFCQVRDQFQGADHGITFSIWCSASKKNPPAPSPWQTAKLEACSDSFSHTVARTLHTTNDSYCSFYTCLQGWWTSTTRSIPQGTPYKAHTRM